MKTAWELRYTDSTRICTDAREKGRRRSCYWSACIHFHPCSGGPWPIFGSHASNPASIILPSDLVSRPSHRHFAQEDLSLMSHWNLGWLLAIAAVAILGIAVSYSAPSREKDRDYELVRLVVDVLQEVRQRYVVDIDADRERKLVEDMINGGLERLDPHSQYINPKDNK